MHASSSLVILALFTAYVSAFYPYVLPASPSSDSSDAPSRISRRSPFYTWKNEPHNAGHSSEGTTHTLKMRREPKAGVDPKVWATQELAYLRRRFRGRSLPASESIGKRENTYKVAPATPPTQPDSVAIDQDGTDFSYFSTVKFGTEGKEIRMLVDTGASNTWVMGSDCKSKACNAHTTFGKDDSTSLKTTNNKFEVTYGSGTVSGFKSTDTVSLAGFTVPLTFGQALEISDEFLAYPMDGLLGLGRTASNKLDAPTLMDVLADEKKLKANVLAVNLQRHADGANDGVLSFGAWDDSEFDGDLSWTPSVSKDGLWEIPVEDAGVDGKGVKFNGKSAIIDTGTSFILLPPDDAKKLHAQFSGVKQNGENYELPCSTTVPLQFTFSGVTYDVSPKDYLGPKTTGDLCESNIIGLQTFGLNQWLLGDTFLKNMYSVYDFDQDRIEGSQQDLRERFEFFLFRWAILNFFLVGRSVPNVVFGYYNLNIFYFLFFLFFHLVSFCHVYIIRLIVSLQLTVTDRFLVFDFCIPSRSAIG
ncbi:MAG: hypothetical protein M1817_003991 [Caeruleum heppii]|nr:MAG: hypothetical protein M1817_003991 [Caeruleum heppii]